MRRMINTKAFPGLSPVLPPLWKVTDLDVRKHRLLLLTLGPGSIASKSCVFIPHLGDWTIPCPACLSAHPPTAPPRANDSTRQPRAGVSHEPSLHQGSQMWRQTDWSSGQKHFIKRRTTAEILPEKQIRIGAVITLGTLSIGAEFCSLRESVTENPWVPRACQGSHLAFFLGKRRKGLRP